MKITIRNLQKKIPINPKRIKKAILKVLSSEGPKLNGEISVSFVSDKKIARLNRIYLKHDAPTDVMAFDISLKNKSSMLADIVVSAETAFRNSRAFKTGLLRELDLCAIHGTLHLLGYNDNNKKNRVIMREKERFYANTQN